MEQHNLYLPFLDIMINKGSETSNIWMDMFYKKTGTRTCVPFNSCYPKQCKNHIPFTLAKRICTIVENREVRQKRLDELQKVLYSQEYPQNLIREAVRKAASIPIENLRVSKAKNDSNNLAFLTTFNPNNKNVFPLIQTVFKSLQQSNETKECFKDIKLIKSQRQPSSLKKLLSRAIYSTKKEHCSNKCTKTRCACCDHIKEGSFHTFKTTGDTFYLKEDMTCESSDLVYVVICSICHKGTLDSGQGSSFSTTYPSTALSTT